VWSSSNRQLGSNSGIKVAGECVHNVEHLHSEYNSTREVCPQGRSDLRSKLPSRRSRKDACFEDRWKSHAIYPFLSEGISEPRHFVSSCPISTKTPIELDHVNNKAQTWLIPAARDYVRNAVKAVPESTVSRPTSTLC
jgi:hypothetical protein